MGGSRAIEPGTREKLAFLRDPRHYAGAPLRVEVIETHFAWVFLAGSRVYKMKKPIRQDAMDYRTLAARERACRSELRLNRRLAGGVYLEVVPLRRRRGGGLTLAGRGRIVEWLVVMQRLPSSRMLDAAIRARAVDARDVRRIAGRLTTFFAGATLRGLSAPRYRARLRKRIATNARELLSADLGLDARRIEPVIEAQVRYVERARGVLAQRAARLRDGHGDLRPEHVYLGPPACVIDCLEFAADLRRLDPVEEIAFLALECARLGAGELASELVRQYCRLSHDRVPDSLLHFYMSQRAITRAKIAAWHLRDPQFPSRRPWVVRANSYLEDALRHARLALAGDGDGRAGSVVARNRPRAQQRRKRRTARHAAQRFSEQRRDRQHAQLRAGN